MPTSSAISATLSALTDVESFLMSQDHHLHNVLSDGYCMFRALSHELYGSDEHHHEVQRIPLEMIKSLTNLTGMKICHWEVTFLQRLANLGSWGTQVELQAVSDYFNITVFVSKSLRYNEVGGKGNTQASRYY